LFIVGVSLFFVPRLSGVPLGRPRLVGWAVGLLFWGVVARVIAQPILVALPSSPIILAFPFSAVMEATGIGLYLYLILSSILRAPKDRKALTAVRPFLVISLVGWAGFAALNVDLSIGAWRAHSSVFDIRWSRLAIDLYVGATLVPVALAFSVRTFPLYLRLPAPNWAVQRLGIGYVVAFAFSWWVDAAGDVWEHTRTFSGLAHGVKGLLLLLFVWKLDVLFRRRPPWTAGQIAQPSKGDRSTRPGLPDHGEFGSFERLLYLAYGWLIVAAILEVWLGIFRVVGAPDPMDADALRHIYLAGFVSSLLIGMAPRMVPGFVHQRGVAFPALVGVTFWLWALGSSMRILPLLLDPFLPATEMVAHLSAISFGISGVIGWCAVAVLAVNILVTLRRSSIESASRPEA